MSWPSSSLRPRLSASARSRGTSALKGGDKILLKALLRRMEDAGLLAKRQRKLIDRSSLPPVTVLEIIGTDKDGEAYAEPVEWDERQAGKPPHVVIEGGDAAPRKGDRVLAKIQPSKDGRYKFRARVIKAISDRSNKVLGVYRVFARRRRPHHSGRQEGPA